jgi:hypothetical protein
MRATTALKLSYTADDGKTYDIEKIGGGETYGRLTIGGDKSFVARFTEKRFPSKDEGDPDKIVLSHDEKT